MILITFPMAVVNVKDMHKMMTTQGSVDPKKAFGFIGYL